MLNTRLIPSVVCFIVGMLIIAYMKPAFLFDSHDGSIKEFGVGQRKTIYSMGVVVVALSVLCFYLFSVIDLMLR